MAKVYVVKVTDSGKAVREIKVDVSRGEPVRILANPGDRIQLFDSETGKSPKKVIGFRVGEDLHLEFHDEEGDPQLVGGKEIPSPDVIIEKYYAGETEPLTGETFGDRSREYIAEVNEEGRGTGDDDDEAGVEITTAQLLSEYNVELFYLPEEQPGMLLPLLGAGILLAAAGGGGGGDSNDAPVAVDDAATTNEDTSVSGNVLVNDTDDDGDDLTVASYTQPANGSVVVNSDGSFTYTPDANFNGTDTFTYVATDGEENSNAATVTITVNPVNDAPVANDDTAQTDEDTPVSGNVLMNDTDVDGDTLSVTGNTQPSHGTVVVNSDGSFTYTPDADYNGTDSFTYTVSDGNGGTDTATVILTVHPANDPPVAIKDEYSTNEDTVLNVTLPGVLGNDSDTDGDSLGVVSNTDPANGTLTLNADGSFSYTPDADFNGTDSFDYTVSDGNGGTSTTSVTITVVPVNDPPVAMDDTASVNEDATTGNLHGTLLSNDTDVDHDAVLDIQSVNTAGTVGTVAFDGTANTLTYAADGASQDALKVGETMTDTFSYTVVDEHGATDTATVTVTVTGVNDPPVAMDDTASVNEDATTGNLHGTLLSNDTDVDHDAVLDIQSVNTAGTVGTVAFDGTANTLTYAADGASQDALKVGETMTDTFSYTVVDEHGATDTATVTVTVTGVNDPPTSSVTVTDEDVYESGLTTGTAPSAAAREASGTLVYSDVDTGDTLQVVVDGMVVGTLDGDSAHTIGSYTGSHYGTITFKGDGSWVYVLNDPVDNDDPAAIAAGATGAQGPDTFQVQVYDGTAYSTAQELTVVIHDDAPVPITPKAGYAMNAVDPAGDEDFTGALDVDGIIVQDVQGSVGADRDGATVAFSESYDGIDSGLTSGGLDIYYYVDDINGTVLTASTANSEEGVTGDNTVFTVTLDPASSEYVVDMVKTVDGSVTDVSFEEGMGYDFTGGIAPWAYFLDEVGDDDLLLTPPDGSKVNTTASQGGIGNTTIEAGEFMRLDFVNNLSGTPGTGTYNSATPSHTFDDHYDVNGASVAVYNGGTKQSNVMITSNYDDDLPSGDDHVGDGAPVTIVAVGITYGGVTQVFYEDTPTVDVGGKIYSVDFIETGPNAGSVVVGSVDNGTILSAYGEDVYNSLEVGNAGNYDIDGDGDLDPSDTFAIGGFGTLSIEETYFPVEVSLTDAVAITDGDGDMAYGTIDMLLLPETMTYDTAVTGTAGNDTLVGTALVDMIYGDSGDDNLSGGLGNDMLYGGKGIDSLDGGDGNDILNGGAVNDTLTGGTGTDTFAYYLPDEGHDTIMDFSNGTELIEIPTSYGTPIITDSGADTVITFATSPTQITLTGVDHTLITIDDFRIV